MPKRKAEAVWNGTFKDGNGTVELGSGAFKGPYSYKSRFDNQDGTNPEELIGAAHASCFSMAFSMLLSNEGYQPEEIHTDGYVELTQGVKGVRISGVELTVKAKVPDITDAVFNQLAEEAKQQCPVSKALAVPITLNAELRT